MPGLVSVCVWELPFPPVGVEIDTVGSPNIEFKTNCSFNIDIIQIENQLSIYPNPCSEFLNLELKYSQMDYIEIFNINGINVFKSIINSSKYALKTIPFDKGVYLIKVYSNKGYIYKKIVIQ